MGALGVYDVLRRPIVTEKSSALMAEGKYAFEVAKSANKFQIKRSVETAFKVTVIDVHIVNMHGKTKRVGRGLATTPSWKKAIVTLKEGDAIELFQGV